MLHTDIPTESEFRNLDAVRGDICVSIYLPTTPVTRNSKGDRILFGNLANDAIGQLREAKASKRRVAAIENFLQQICDDDLFWAYMADGLAVFATPDEIRTFRLPIAPTQAAEVSDRFHIKPLVPLLAFPGTCFVLALSQGAVRFIEVTSSLSSPVKVDGLPKNMSDALKKQLPRDRAPTGRIQGSEGMKVLMGQYCRIVDRALRPILTGQTIPLVLASVGELAAIYRAQNTYPHLLPTAISGNPEQMTDRELAELARAISTKQAKKIVRDRVKLVEERSKKGLASIDVARIASAAVRGQVGTLLVDVGVSLPGTIHPDKGTISVADGSSASSYDLLDELVGLTVRAGGEVLPVKSSALPKACPVAAIFRYRG